MLRETKIHIQENEQYLILDHAYRSLPFRLPITICCGIIFSTLCLIFYTTCSGPFMHDEFSRHNAVLAAKIKKYKKKESQFNQTIFASFNNPEGIKKGQTLFEVHCIACHLEKGAGDIGPNLTDNYWLNSRGTPATNYPIIYNGVIANGMPVWSEVLSRDEIYQVVAYVQTLHNTFIPNGKAPQGNKVE